MNNSLAWQKLGHVYAAQQESDLAYSHGKSRAIILLDDRIRAYTIVYSKPDSKGIITSRTCYVDLDRRNPASVIGCSTLPVLDLGDCGDFDEHGVMAECVVRRGSELWMYYDGWSRRTSIPYEWSIGLAISRDGGATYRRYGRGPVIGPSVAEPYLFAAPFVMPSGNGQWHMWYLGGDSWKTDESGHFYAAYTLRHATSSDGIIWQRESTPCIDNVLDEECQAGPTVFSVAGLYHMLFSYRSAQRRGSGSQGYRLGHAVSSDLKVWRRDDAASTIHGDPSSWDAEMMCYPQVLDVDGRIYLFYSGNDCGRTGFGVAVLER